MNEYFIVKMNSRNELRAPGGFEIYGIALNNLDFKIDTGCGYTMIPLKKTQLPDTDIIKYRDMDYSNPAVIKKYSFGVNDTEEFKSRCKTYFKNGQFDKINSVTVRKNINNFNIAGYNFGNLEVGISYTRTGNILIGMDILSRCKLFIAKELSGDISMIGCLDSKINDRFYMELDRLYRLGADINSAIARNLMTQ